MTTMKEIRISYENEESPIINIRDNGVSLNIKKIDPYDRWKIIEKLEEAKEELMRIHKASW